jgi:hypothetical protein
VNKSLDQDAKYEKPSPEGQHLTDKKQYGEAAKCTTNWLPTATWPIRMTARLGAGVL